jgi:2-polyprenyl-3-methyl-5-hydroxy-6-metoxy-1,4-benzoquinol methylase
MEDLRATDPHQYDSPDLDWSSSGAKSSSSRTYLREQIEEVLAPNSLKGKRVLDIGAGVGQLFNWLKDKGATEVVGIDPSKRNIEFTQKEYPWVTSVRATLQEFAAQNSEPFDAAFGIYVFEHIRNLNEAFRDVSALLKNDGTFFLIIGDKEYNLSSDMDARGSRFVSVKVLQEFDDGTVETEIHRKNEAFEPITMYDVFRPMELVREAAAANNFNILTEQPILGPQSKPPAERKHTMCHLFVFKKQ